MMEKDFTGPHFHKQMEVLNSLSLSGGTFTCSWLHQVFSRKILLQPQDLKLQPAAATTL